MAQSLALTAMVSAGLIFSTNLAPVLAQQSADAAKAAVAAAKILTENGEHQAVRDLLRPFIADDAAALAFVRAGIALKTADSQDFVLAARLADAGNLSGARIVGDMLRQGIGVTADFERAEAAYRRAIELGDAASRKRLADLFSQAKRYPEAIAAYAELKADDPSSDRAFTILSITRGNVTDTAELAALIEHLDTLSLTDAAAARTAAAIFERGDGVEIDKAKAVTYARRAVQLGDTNLGLMAAQDCDTCTALELVGLLKATAKLDDVEKTSNALVKPLERGFYADSWEIISRFPPADRTAIAAHMLEKFGAVSNPVVALTQSLMLAGGEFDGEVDGMLTSSTLAAVQRYAAAREITLVRFDTAFVGRLFASAE
jgi:TPR repeat protein